MTTKRNFNHPISCLVCSNLFLPWIGRENSSFFCSIRCNSKNKRTKDFLACFFSKTKEIGDCWIWTGSKNKLGYGLYKSRSGGIPRRTHRISFEIFNCVDLKSDQHICHSCDTPSCINPAHLFVGNPSINSNDARVKGRLKRKIGSASLGELHPKTFLKEQDILAIRSSTQPTQEIAEKFDLHPNSVRGIRSKRTWKHI